MVVDSPWPVCTTVEHEQAVADRRDDRREVGVRAAGRAWAALEERVAAEHVPVGT
jgi:hypothetical protein